MATTNGLLTITPATPTLTLTGGEFNYSGSAIAATTTLKGVADEALTPAAKVFYQGSYITSNSNAAYAQSETAPIEPGTYSVTASFEGNKNYNPATAGPVTLTIVDKVKPVVVTKDITVKLDANGVASIAVANIDNNSTDNHQVLSRVLNKTSFNCDNLGENKVALTVTDLSGNTATATATVTVVDEIKPAVTAAADINTTTSSDDTANCTVSVVIPNATSSDNCSVTSLTWVMTGAKTADGNGQIGTITFPIGTTTIVYTVKDASNNTSTDEMVVTVTDDEKPTFSTPASITRKTDEGSLQYTVNATELDAINITDNCSVAKIEYELTGATKGNGDNTLAGVKMEFGLTTITWTVTDKAGNATTATTSINVNAVNSQMLTLNAAPAAVQYSDNVTYTAQIKPWTGSGDLTPSGYVEFTTNGVFMGRAEVGTNGEATLVAPLIESKFDQSSYDNNRPTAGLLMPGSKEITAVFKSANNNYQDISNTLQNGLSILEEESLITLDNSRTYFSADPVTGKATISMKTSVQDALDNSNGDIRNSMIQFMDAETGKSISIGTLLPVTLENSSDLTKGSTTYNFEQQLNNQPGRQWLVWPKASNYYKGDDRLNMNILTLGVPGLEFLSGSGFIIQQNSTGALAGTAGQKMNFGFHMKWNNSGQNLQGQLNILYRRIENGVTRLYLIKSNAIEGTVIGARTFVDSDGTERAYTTSNTITTKASLIDITDEGNPISVAGNLLLNFTAWDDRSLGSQGDWDKVSVELRRGTNNELVFTNNFDGSASTASNIRSGNINVRDANTSTPEACSTPRSLATDFITSGSANLNWSLVAGATGYNVQYRVQGASDWIQLSGIPTMPYALNGLTQGTSYEWQVQTACLGSMSPFSTTMFFTTGTVCSAVPTGLSTSNVANTSAQLSWVAVSGAVSYNIEYQIQGGTSSFIFGVTSTAYTLNGLSEATTYNWRVQSVCSSGPGALSPYSNFTTTTSCLPTGIVAQNVTTESAKISWNTVRSAKFYTLQYRESRSTTWSTPVTVSTGTSYDMLGLKSGTAYVVGIAADCNAQGLVTASFTTLVGCDATSLVASGITASTATLSWVGPAGATFNLQYKLNTAAAWTAVDGITAGNYGLTGLSTQSTYNWQVQAVCNGTEGNWSAIASFKTTSVAACLTPSGLIASNITGTSATFKWGAVTGAKSYNVQYRLFGATTFTVVPVTKNTLNLTGLVAGKQYEWNVQTVCTTGNSTVSAINSFNTITPCAPFNLSVSSISTSAATLNWSGSGSNATYRVEYRKRGSSSYIAAVISTTSSALTSLAAGTTYEWRVTSICDGKNGSTVNGPSFTTLKNGSGRSAEDVDTTDENVFNPSITARPNPTHGPVSVKISGFYYEPVMIRVTDMRGAIIFKQEVQFHPDMQSIDLNLENAPVGMIFIQAIQGNTTITERVVKN
ncbi:MAG: fibronectin type III domain-containing protein [Bacteroidetes bacterium]|nr:fibronectin type III domain-containing protein [Bacteroidota bacterium]